MIYNKHYERVDGHPSELPRTATLVTWVDKASRDDAETVDFGERSTDCIGIQIEICSECESQKGQEEITTPDVPDILVLSTSSCTY